MAESLCAGVHSAGRGINSAECIWRRTPMSISVAWFVGGNVEATVGCETLLPSATHDTAQPSTQAVHQRTRRHPLAGRGRDRECEILEPRRRVSPCPVLPRARLPPLSS